MATNKRVVQHIDETESSISNSLTAFSLTGSRDDHTNILELTEKEKDNAIPGDAIHLEILKLLTKIQSEMKACVPASNSEENKKRQSTCHRQDTPKYCWSYRAWNHLSKDCFRKSRAL